MKAVLTADRIMEILRGGPLTYRALTLQMDMQWRDQPSDIAEKLAQAVREGQVEVVNDELRGRLYALPETEKI